MEKGRTDYTIKESGIALITTMVITLVILMLIAGLTYLLTRGFRANVINKEFASVYDAANGGAEHAAGIINSYWAGTSISGLGSFTGSSDSVLRCSNTTDTLEISTITADGKYRIDTMVRCIGRQAIPGAGGVLSFPPPKGLYGGGSAAWYIFYSIISTAEEINTGSKGRTEAVYRIVA